MPKWTSWFPQNAEADKWKNEVVLYIPSRLADKNMIPLITRAKLIDAAMNFLLKELGGATHIEGKGYYLGKDGKAHVEDVTLCICYCPDSVLKEHGKELNKIANSLAIECGQEALAVTLNGEMALFEPTPRYREIYRNVKAGWKKKPPTEGYLKYLYDAFEA